MSYSRISIHDWRDGAWLTTIESQTTRSWVLSDCGECELTMPLSDAKTRQQYFAIGNLIYIEHDTLPAWGGKLMPPYRFNNDQTVSFNFISGEATWKLRRTPYAVMGTGESTGALYKKFIDWGNRAESLLVSAGSIWEGSTPCQEALDAKSIYDHVTNVAERRGHDWNWDVVRDPVTMKLSFLAGWWERRGVESAITLEEGRNVKNKAGAFSVQRWPVNDILGIGEGDDTGRPMYRAYDNASIGKYGLMEGSEDFSGAVSVDLVAAMAFAKVRELREPRRIHEITALNVDDTFSALRLGNVLPYRTQTLGFNGLDGVGINTNVRIKGMRYSDKTGECDLVVDEV